MSDSSELNAKRQFKKKRYNHDTDTMDYHTNQSIDDNSFLDTNEGVNKSEILYSTFSNINSPFNTFSESTYDGSRNQDLQRHVVNEDFIYKSNTSATHLEQFRATPTNNVQSEISAFAIDLNQSLPPMQLFDDSELNHQDLHYQASEVTLVGFEFYKIFLCHKFELQ